MSELVKKVIVYADAHAPNHCRQSVNITKKIVAAEKPDYLINLGDGGDFESINHWNKNRLLLREGRRLAKDINSMIALDEEIAAEARDNCTFIRHIGNHEHWVDLFVQTHPELQGLEEFEIAKRYKELDWIVYPWGEFSRLGKLFFHHGDRRGYQQQFHSKFWSMSGCSVMYGHRHDFQRYTGEILQKKGDMIPNAGFSVGCLGKRTPKWMENRRNNWSNGIAIVYIRPGGYFNAYLLDFIKGGCVWNGQIYKG